MLNNTAHHNYGSKKIGISVAKNIVTIILINPTKFELWQVAWALVKPKLTLFIHSFQISPFQISPFQIISNAKQYGAS